MKQNDIIAKFVKYYGQLDLKDLSKLDEIYSINVSFTDPIKEMKGLDALKKHFAGLNKNLISARFEFKKDYLLCENDAVLEWEMHLCLKRPKKEIAVAGVSVLKWENKITHQRDYFDLGKMMYEQIPFLGSIIRLMKRKLAGT